MDVFSQNPEIYVDPQGREIAQHGTPLFPMRIYCVDMWKYIGGYATWHWHDECEFMAMREGEMVVEYGGGSALLRAGDALFLNSGQIHAVQAKSEPRCTMVSVVFSADLLSGPPPTIFDQKYIQPLIRSDAARTVSFHSADEADRRIVDLVGKLEHIYAGEEFRREMDLRSTLAELWLEIGRRCFRGTNAILSADPHIKDLLSFIHHHYTEDITLKDIAASAGISIRTCCRSFREQLHTTAFAYLQRFRIGQGAEQLAATAKTVSEIAYDVGFSDPSYFSRVFRSATGLTPQAYRAQFRSP